MAPKVSVLWLNYNSMHVIDLTRESIRSLIQLNYPNYEIILVDNCSIDGSCEVIEQYLKYECKDSGRIRFLKLKKNHGWIGGINAAYDLRDRDSKYIALTHNDLIAKPDYLINLVSFLEQHKDVGAVQGVVVRLDNALSVDSAGYLLDETLTFSLSHRKAFVNEINRPSYVSFVEGTMPVYNENLLRRFSHSDHALFVSGAFMHYLLEDMFVSLSLWSHGYKCVSLPVIVASHYRLAAIGKVSSQELYYISMRNKTALLYLTNSAEKLSFIIKNIRRTIIGRGAHPSRKIMIRSIIDGLKLGRQLKKKYGLINIYNGPILRRSMKARFLIF